MIPLNTRPVGIEARTLVEVLRAHAAVDPARVAFTYLRDGEDEASDITYGAIDRRACAIAVALRARVPAGDRVLLLQTDALEYIAAFCGCLYAGVVAVPAYPPRLRPTLRANRPDARLRSLVLDARPALALASAELTPVLGALAAQDPAWAAVSCLSTESLADEGARGVDPAAADPGAVAFLQYTSGSTSAPRGVMVTHANIMHAQEALHRAFHQSADSVIVGWLPLYHDMGLIGNVLHTLYLGARGVLLPSMAFLQQPVRWLRAISRFRATTSGGPNFAYDLCARRVEARDREALDLSSWTVAFNGAEPVQAGTIERFSAAFAECGFRRTAFQPCYGLAEATLMVTAARGADRPVVRRFRRDALEAGRASDAGDAEDAAACALVACGTPDATQQIAIVDPATGRRCAPDAIGEIWVAGPGVGPGYWQKPDESARVFGARCGEEGPFLRTGDLGVVRDGELYVAGRLKDLIILRGRNLHPQDLEATVERSHPALRPGCGVACAVDVDGEERLVIVHEVRREIDPAALQAVCHAIQRSLVREHEAPPYAIALVEPGRVPKTSSGKLQRRLCRTQFLKNELGALLAWTAPAPVDDAADRRAPAAADRGAVKAQVVAILAEVCRLPATRIDPHASVATLGLDSLRAAELQAALERTCGARVSQAAMLDGPTVEQLVTLVMEENAAAPGAPLPEPPVEASPRDGRVSRGQRALWFLQQLAPQSAAYHIARAGRVRGRLHVAAMEHALQSLVERHSALRAAFAAVEGEPVQRLQAAAVDFAELDAAGWSDADVRRVLVEESERPFDLARGPLVRARVLTRSADEYVLLLVVHHIAADLWSLTLLMRELGVLYAAHVARVPVLLSKLEFDHADYVRWHHGWMQGPEAADSRAFWLRGLRDVPPLDLPIDRRRPPMQTFRGASERCRIPAPLAGALAEIARTRHATPQMALLAAFQMLLGRYAAQECFAVISPAAGRTTAALHGVVGYLVNPLAIDADLRGDPSFFALLDRVRGAVTAALRHQSYPFDAIVEALRQERDPSRPAVAQVMFAYQASPGHDDAWGLLALGEPGARLEIGGLTMESVAVPETTAQFELTLAAAETAGALALVWHYNADLFEPETVRRMAAAFVALIEAVVSDPASRSSDLPLMAEAERRTIVETWNATDASYPGDMLLDRLIAAQAARTPTAVALVSGEHTWTYQALGQRVERLARGLRARGVGPDVVVGVCMERSPDLVVALLATLEAGGAYLPLDPAHPPDRVRLLLHEAGARIVVAQPALRHLVASAGQTVYDVETLLDDAGDAGGPGATPRHPDQLAYVIYTSGSTGVPKGVMVSHRAICNRLLWMQETYALTSSDAVLQKTPSTFDVSVWELFWPLMTGARLVLAGPQDHRDSARLVRLIVEHRITTIHFVPSMFQAVLAEPGLEACTSLQRVICSGEALPSDLPRASASRLAAAVHNLYGPTEAAVDVTAWQTEPLAQAATAPIGRPIANIRIYVLDRRLAPVPVGVCGEIHIGGVGLARGYCRRPDLTADRFIPNPFGGPGSRLYRTGDLARYRADGAVEFLGRRDQQVKIRGFRIELAEVEAALAKAPGVRECAVDLRPGGHGPRLVGYVVPAATPLDVAAIRRALGTALPDYMVPHILLPCDALPVTSSGKLDRRALPAPPPEGAAGADEYTAPSTAAEEALAAIWATVLDVKRVGTTQNFFGLGGDSIRALQVTALARERGLAVSLQQVFQHQTIAELAPAAVEASPALPAPAPRCSLLREEDRARVPAEIEDAYPLTQLQAGLVFHSEYQRDYVIYCVSADLRAPFDEGAMRAALAHVIARHPILRTSYELVAASEPLQLVHASASIPLTVEDLTGLSEEAQDASLADWIEREMRRPFDWSAAPLVRVHVHRRGPSRVQFNLSHPLLDGWSTASLITELFESYFALLHRRPLPAPRPSATTFADFVRLERQAVESDECRAYWLRKIEGSANGLLPRWPADRRGPGSLPVRHTFAVPPGVLEGLKHAARTAAVPLKSTFVAVHARVLAAVTGERDVLTGMISNGRIEGPDGDRVLGLFLNTVPLRLTVDGGTWIDLLTRAFDAERETLPYRRYPFAELQRLNGGHAPFETAINIINFHVYDRLRAIPQLELLHRTTSYDQTFFPLTSYFELDVFSSSLLLHLDVNAPDLGDEQVAALGGYYLRALEQLAADPGCPIDSRPVTGADEERRLTAGFNQTAAEYVPVCLHELFEAQAARRPEAPAVTTDLTSLTYGELNERANRLAHHLRAQGIGRDDLVGLCTERTPEAIVGLMGILKAGAAYVPLDPEFPRERLAFMAEDAALGAIVTQSALVDRVPAATPLRVCLDTDGDAIARQPAENPVPVADPASRIYLIYTSGSTGRPKGVEVCHRNVANLVAWYCRELAVTETDVMPAIATLGFDMSVPELFVPLTAGACMLLVDRRTASDAERLGALIRQSGVTVMQATPTMWRMLVDAGWRGSRRLRALSGAEPLPQDLVPLLRERCRRLWNLYGPTETTVWSTAGGLDDDERPVSIGRPIANTQIYVLDPHLRPRPIGVPGRLFIGGDGVTRGYLRRPDLTGARFVPDPFSPQPGARLYDTGDLARYLPDGTIDFLGRVDDQIKVRGFRIELAEIEAALVQYPGVREAAVSTQEYAAGDVRLTAFLVCEPGAAPAPSVLRQFVASKLPEYMVPVGFVVLDALPRTPSGKIHRPALARVPGAALALGDPYEEPRTPLERQLASMWAEVLRVPRVGLRDSFFGLGGHSLIAMQIVSRVRARLQPRLPLSALFEAPTIAQFAEAIERLGTDAARACPSP